MTFTQAQRQERGTRALHPVNDSSSVVWHGGIGHNLLSIDGGGVECYRCGMAAEGSAWQELVPDCDGPAGGNHHWMGEYASDDTERIACAYGDAWIGPYGGMEHAGGRCKRA